MNRKEILEKVIYVLNESNIHSYPIDCEQILQNFGYRILSYSEIKRKNPELLELCESYSDDSFRDYYSKTIAYNDVDIPYPRIRFSLMHELGHIIMDHKGRSLKNEQDANYFATNILAPRMAIHYSGCKNANHVAKFFMMSFEAAEYAFDDYRRWHRRAVYKMSEADRKFYNYFYNENVKKFVYSLQECVHCGNPIYNTPEKITCPICNYRTAMMSYVHDPFSINLYAQAHMDA